MTLTQALVLGIIQGLGEFLPISSSGHLVLTPWLFKWEDPGLAFDVALHMGTLLAVGIYFFKDWLLIFKSAFTRTAVGDIHPNLLWWLAAATIPGALVGYLFEEQAETVLRNPLLIAGTLSIVGFVLYWADKRSRGMKNLEKLTLRDGIMIGIVQALAIVPGVSRSGSTITAGLMLGYDRINAARFSFLLSTPVIFGAAVLKFDDFLANGVGLYELVGIATAAISGYLAIAGLLKFVQKVSYKVFFWYRLALAVSIVLIYLFR